MRKIGCIHGIEPLAAVLQRALSHKRPGRVGDGVVPDSRQARRGRRRPARRSRRSA